MTDTFNDADGRRVVAADTAEDIGQIKGFVVDPSGRRIAAIHVGGRGSRADVVPWSAIASFGADAVMVRAADAVQRVDSDREVEAVKGRVAPRGSRILTTHGVEVGAVENVTFEADTGAVVAATTDAGTSFTADRFRSLGSYALVVDAM